MDGWTGWIGLDWNLLRRLVLLEHLTVLINQKFLVFQLNISVLKTFDDIFLLNTANFVARHYPVKF